MQAAARGSASGCCPGLLTTRILLLHSLHHLCLPPLPPPAPWQIKSASLNVSLAAFLVGFTGAGLNASSAISWAFSGGGTGANRTASLAPGAALPTTRQLRLRLNTPAPLLLTNGSGVRVSMVGGVADGYIDGAYQLIRYLYSFQRGTCSWQLASAAAGGSVAAAAAGCPRVTLGSPYRACGSPPGVSGGLVGGGMRLYLNTTLGCIPEGAFSSVNLTAGGVEVGHETACGTASLRASLS